MENFGPIQNQFNDHRSAMPGPYWFNLPEQFDPALPERLRDAEDEARHFMDSVTRKLARGDVDEQGFAHLHTTVLDRTIRHRTRGPIIRALREGYLQVSPHLAGRHSRGYKLSEEMLAQKPVRRACRDLVLLRRIRSEQARLDEEEREHWLPIHRDLAQLQRGLTVTADADAILETLEALARYCQRILLSNIRDGRFTFSVSQWGRCFNALCGVKRELRPALRLNGQHLAALDIRCAQPALLALLIEAASPTSRLFNRTTYLHARWGSLLSAPAPLPVPLRERRRFRELVCGGSFNEWLAEKTGLPRDEAKRRFLVDVLAKRGSYTSEVENCFESEFPSVHRFLAEAREQDYRATIRSLQRLESWLVIEKVAPLLVGRAAIVTLHDAIFCGESDLPLVQEAFEEVFEKIGFRLSLKEEKWGPTHSAKVT